MLRLLKDKKFHEGESLADRLRHMVSDAAKNTKRDEVLDFKAQQFDGSQLARKIPYPEQLQFVMQLVNKLGFTIDNIFSKRDRTVDVKYALDAFECYHTFVDQFPDSMDCKRTNNGLLAARKCHSAKRNHGAPIVHNIVGVGSNVVRHTFTYWRRKNVALWVVKMISKTLDHIMGIRLALVKAPKNGEEIATCRIDGFYHGKWYPDDADRGCFACKSGCKFGHKWLDECPVARAQLRPIWVCVFDEDLLT